MTQPSSPIQPTPRRRIERCCLFFSGVLLFFTVSQDFSCAVSPENLKQFFLLPNEENVLQFIVESASPPQPIGYEILDSSGKRNESVSLLPQGKVVPVDNRIAIPVRLPQGFWEIRFPETDHRFGLVSLPPVAGKRDPFFSIDAALSWLVQDDKIREELVEIAARVGISMIRERIRWKTVEPEENQWSFETEDRYDSLRSVFKKQDIDALEFLYETPEWMEKNGLYPANLLQTARSWETFVRHWTPTLGGLEIWNEPDIEFFGGDLPADQYVSLAQTVDYTIRSKKLTDKPVIAGCMALFNRPWLENLAECGLLDEYEYFSFHTYFWAPEVESLCGRFRYWLVENNRGAMPLWLTECGQPWQTGPDRPPMDQDWKSACDVVMKAVEAKACGVERYFVFLYPFFEEGVHNFGMMDKHGSPLRIFAAYAQAIRVLSFKDYVGDLVINHPSLLRARVFADADAAVAVFYTGKTEEQFTIPLPLRAKRLEALTGECQKDSSTDSGAVENGLLYAWFDRKEIVPFLNVETPAMRQYKLSMQKLGKKETVPSPLVFIYRYDTEKVEPTTAGYRLKESPEKGLDLSFRAFNLSTEEKTFTFECFINEFPYQNAVGPITLSPEGYADFFIPIRESLSFGCRERLLVRIVAKDSEGVFCRKLALFFLDKK
jgi:hypothetical protein